MENNQKEAKPKQEKPLLQVLVGIITPALMITIIILILNVLNNAAAILISFVLIIVPVFLGVKLIRKNYKIAGIIILSISVPALVLGMAAGACALILSGSNL